jgi:hypothetical protein
MAIVAAIAIASLDQCSAPKLQFRLPQNTRARIRITDQPVGLFIAIGDIMTEVGIGGSSEAELQRREEERTIECSVGMDVDLFETDLNSGLQDSGCRKAQSPPLRRP